MKPQVTREQIIDVLKNCYDPEIPVNIYDLGLVYDVALNEGTSSIKVKMTLTSPHCPVAGTLPMEVEKRLKMIPGIATVIVEIVWNPPWDPSRLSEAAKLELGLM